MKSCEKYVLPASEYFNYTPSVTALHSFFYPICTGHFFYEPGYRQQRSSFNSFLIMYIRSGTLRLHVQNQTLTVSANQFVLLDCYQPHGYETSDGFECLWCHFDGPLARSWSEMITDRLGICFCLSDPNPVVSKLKKIYQIFADNETIREPFLSKLLSDLLTFVLLYQPLRIDSLANASSMEEIVSYINQHFTEEITVQELSAQAALSPYHFIRIFKKETGFTPHEYLIRTRIGNACYLLKNSLISVKDVCFRTGFSCESTFCTSFKKNTGLSPAEYRKQTLANTD